MEQNVKYEYQGPTVDVQKDVDVPSGNSPWGAIILILLGGAAVFVWLMQNQPVLLAAILGQ